VLAASGYDVAAVKTAPPLGSASEPNYDLAITDNKCPE